MEFQLHRSFPADMEAAWNTLLDDTANHVPFLRYEYLEAWWQTRGGGEWPESAEPAIVIARKEGRLAGIAPLFLTDRQGVPSLLLLGSIEISDYLDLIARPAEMLEFVEGLLPFLAAEIPAWQALDLNNLFDDSPTLAALQTAAASRGWSYRQEVLQKAPYIPLPGDWEQYLSGIDKKQRHEIRRKMRRAEEAPVQVTMRFAGDPERIETDIQAFLALMEQDPDKAAFLTPLMRQTMQTIIRCAFEKGCVLLSFLEINGENAAAYLSFDYLDRLWVYNSGLDRRFMEYSPGWVLLGRLLQWANEHERKEFDFMRGDEEYKYRFGAIDRRVVRALVTR